VGAAGTIPRIESVLEVDQVTPDGSEVTLRRPGTNLQWFRIKADTLTYVDRKPPARTSNPFTEPEPVFDSEEILERIATVQKENLKRLDDDVDILKAYLKTQHAPRTAIEAVEGPDRRAACELEEGRGPDQEGAGSTSSPSCRSEQKPSPR
jgi:hypothetical protein